MHPVAAASADSTSTILTSTTVKPAATANNAPTSIVPTMNISPHAAQATNAATSTIPTTPRSLPATTSIDTTTTTITPSITSTLFTKMTTNAETSTNSTQTSVTTISNGCRKRAAEEGECVANAECVKEGDAYLCKCKQGFVIQSSQCNKEEMSWGQNRGTSGRSFIVAYWLLIVTACVHLVQTVP
ncbi:hypothetical protein DPMN_060032 [Dreissena polymorpha]|uniref:EGF-like domain-containing protein n=2 Tax=Dreissena polymorpha TaxID=45954 RepID=A0A9D4C4V0_DREPO|nr:hypothetical protein DPMN_060032 [Dreissena polymorpha]